MNDATSDATSDAMSDRVVSHPARRTMRAAWRTGSHVAVREVEAPAPGPGQLLLKVERAGICGSDLHLLHSDNQSTRILGHEFAGTVVELGQDAAQFQLGHTVCSMPTIGCGRCLDCLGGDPAHCVTQQTVGLTMPLNGALAEYVLVGVHETFVLPEGVPAAIGALVEPLAVGLKNMEKARCLPGDALVILGGGPVGLATALWARALGVADIIVSDPVASRRELALRLGATAVVDPAHEDLRSFCLRELKRFPETVIECVGRPGSIDMATAIAARAGHVVISGLHKAAETVNRTIPFVKDLTVSFSMMYEKRHFTHTLRMLARRRIDPRALITHEIGLDDVPRILELLAAPNDFGKVLVNPGLHAGCACHAM
jgi:(R,R)-butanediol dehydrogenase/meso-butanediol dehydrogenase/diacetyl reductase